jgi:hypothetical protein
MTGLQKRPRASGGIRAFVGDVARIDVGVGGQGESSGVNSAPKRREKDRSLETLEEWDSDMSR